MLSTKQTISVFMVYLEEYTMKIPDIFSNHSLHFFLYKHYISCVWDFSSPYDFVFWLDFVFNIFFENIHFWFWFCSNILPCFYAYSFFCFFFKFSFSYALPLWFKFLFDFLLCSLSKMFSPLSLLNSVLVTCNVDSW